MLVFTEQQQLPIWACAKHFTCLHANRAPKACSYPGVIGEMQIKEAMRYSLTTIRLEIH